MRHRALASPENCACMAFCALLKIGVMLDAERSRLDTSAALQLVSATAAAAASERSESASEVAAYSVRLQLLRVALHQSATAVTSSSAIGSGAQVDTGESLLWPRLTHTRGMLHVLA